MTKPSGTCVNGLPQVEIKAIQTVTPCKVTEHRTSCRLSVPDPICPAAFKGSMNMVMYYNKVTEEEGSGWIVAGWFKESIGMALIEKPILAGRIRKLCSSSSSSSCDHNEFGYEIVPNDCGVRLVEADIGSMCLSEFLALQIVDRVKLEHEKLVFWNDIDQEMPQFFPLVYVQVTNFQCGGYSIGISCSLLLVNIFIMDNFLQKWAKIHKEVAKNKNHILPYFHHHILKRGNVFPTTLASTPSKNRDHQVMFFKVAGTSKNVESNKNELTRNLALLCIEEVEKKLDDKMGPEYVLLVTESNNKIIRGQICSKNEICCTELDVKNNYEAVSSSWVDFGLKELEFSEGKRPAYVSCWIGSSDDNGLVMATPCNNYEGNFAMNIVVKMSN